MYCIWKCRLNGEVSMCVATPVLGVEGEAPDCLLLNYLPFAEDLRAAKFGALDRDPKLVPSAAQLADMQALLSAMSLESGTSLVILYRCSHACQHSVETYFTTQLVARVSSVQNQACTPQDKLLLCTDTSGLFERGCTTAHISYAWC